MRTVSYIPKHEITDSVLFGYEYLARPDQHRAHILSILALIRMLYHFFPHRGKYFEKFVILICVKVMHEYLGSL